MASSHSKCITPPVDTPSVQVQVTDHEVQNDSLHYWKRKFDRLTAEVERQEKEIISHNNQDLKLENQDLKHENQDLKHKNQDLKNKLARKKKLRQNMQHQLRDLQRKFDARLEPGVL